MTPVPENETSDEALEATKRWYQTKWGKGLVATIVAGIVLGALGWGWSHIEAAAADVAEQAESGETAEALAQKNREKVKRVGQEVDELKREERETSSEILRRLEKLQQSVERNRSEYEQSLQQLRRDIRQIESHHYPTE